MTVCVYVWVCVCVGVCACIYVCECVCVSVKASHSKNFRNVKDNDSRFKFEMMTFVLCKKSSEKLHCSCIKKVERETTQTKNSSVSGSATTSSPPLAKVQHFIVFFFRA